MVEKAHTSGFLPNLADPLRAFGTRVANWVAPASEASTDGDAYRIAVELPGVSEKDIELEAHDGVLSLTGQKSSEREESGDTWFFSEREFGRFSRSFRLPPDADPDAVSADLKDGVLTVTISKKKPSQPAPRKVSIRTAKGD